MNKQKTLLFVDDDKALLDGLRRLLRKKRHQWTMLFAHSGEEALEVMSGHELSIIVTDMRMPGMNGAELLEIVAQSSPNTIRFVLSGQACNELVMQVTHLAHIYLSKPCDQADLLEALERADALHNLFENDKLQKVITKIGSLPSLPDSYNRLRAEISSDEPSIDNVAEIISEDPAMSAKLLQVVNSAFFSLPRRISTPKEAASILGLDTISSMLLAGTVFAKINPKILKAFKLDALWFRGQRVSRIAVLICEQLKLSKDETKSAETAGMLHEVGRLVIAHNQPRLYEAILKQSILKKIPFEAAEINTYNTTSAQIGGFLLGLWGLPNDVINGVAYHLNPSVEPAIDANKITMAQVIYTAKKFEQIIANGNDDITNKKLLTFLYNEIPQLQPLIPNLLDHTRKLFCA